MVRRKRVTLKSLLKPKRRRKSSFEKALNAFAKAGRQAQKQAKKPSKVTINKDSVSTRPFIDSFLIGVASVLLCCTVVLGIMPFSATQSKPEIKQEQKVTPEIESKKEESKATVVTAVAVPKEEKKQEEPALDVKIHFINVGQGDSEFIELPDGKSMLIDAGELDQGQKVTNYISNLGYKKIDYLVATHPHADHIGGLPQVIAAFEIGEIWAPRVAHTTKTYEHFLDAVSAKGLQIHTAQAGEQIGPVDQDYSFKMLAPQSDLSSDDMNDYSIVLKLSYGEKSALFTGDAPAESIAAAGHADLLKVGHHGSKTSTSSAVASSVSPQFAVISYGLGNSYGHPTQQALDALHANNVTVYGTAANGTIVAYMSKTQITMKLETEAEVQAAQEEVKAPEPAPAPQTQAVPEPVASEPSTQPAERTVYITATGKKWHSSPNCRTLKKSKSVTETTLSEAEAQGLTPCKVCAQ